MGRVTHTLTPREHAATFSDAAWVIGFDEVGVGCLAGPVVAALYAYPLTEEWFTLTPPCVIRDSKKMSEKQRGQAATWLSSQRSALFEVIEVSAEEIDALNILRASQEAMVRGFAKAIVRLRALHGDQLPPGAVVVDGNRLPAGFKKLPLGWRAETIVKGDNKSFAIAAASILAKDHRDRLMQDLARVHPEYGWESNVGYPTVQHKVAIQAHGPTPYHRRSFNWSLSE